MSQQLIPVCSGEGVSLSLELGFHGLNPHFGIARVLIEKTGVVVAVPVTNVEQDLTQCCGLLAMFNVGKFAFKGCEYRNCPIATVQALVLSAVQCDSMSCGVCWFLSL